MIRYTVSYTNPHRHFISFEARIPVGEMDTIQFQLAAWRPGRYELGNFSKNIRAWRVSNSIGEALTYVKLSKDLWEVNCAGFSEIILSYEYYAAELNAGSSFLDEEKLYINPVNCFFYLANEPQMSIEVEFVLPENYIVACGLKKKSAKILLAQNFDELADCPVIASASLKHLDYQINDVIYHIWIQGDVKLEEARLVNEFSAFTKAQVRIFGDIPCNEYHFLFHFLPFFVRHGVEHRNSTVIVMGPSADFQGDALFKDLLGISCHELFHTWNVKNIRPVEMMPYDFTKENYSRLGYVYEGVTTYYGDLLLWTSGAISDNEWLEIIDERLQNYFENAGRFNLSIAESSYDTWIDGYVPGIPARKVSIYNEGFLLALVCDLYIIKNMACHSSLDDVMKRLYLEYGKKSLGYSENDYRNIVSDFFGHDVEEYFDGLVNGTSDYTKFIETALSFAGVSMDSNPASKIGEASLGLFIEETSQKISVQSVVRDSPADLSGLWNGDEILSVNGIAPYKNFQLLLKMVGSPFGLEILRKGRRLNLNLALNGRIWSKKYRLSRNELFSDNQQEIFEKWKFRMNKIDN